MILVAQGTRPEADHPAPSIPDRDRQPVAEAIVDPALVVADRHPRFDQVGHGVAQVGQVVDRALPAIRRVAQQEGLDRLRAEAAPFHVGPRDFGLRGVLEQAVEIARRLLQQAQQTLESGIAGALLRGTVLDLDSGPLGQVGQGFLEVPAVLLHGERENIPAFTARAKTAPGLGFWKDDK